MAPTRDVQLTLPQEAALKHLYLCTDNADVRNRWQTFLLLAQGHSAVETADMTSFNRDSALSWFDQPEADGSTGLQDHPRPVRPP